MRRYPYEKWFERAETRTVHLYRGKQFRCQPHSMSVLLRDQASKQGITLSINIHENRVSLKVV